MSRKIFSISKDFSERLVRLMRELGYKNRQHSKFADIIGISDSFLSNVINLDSGPSFGLIFGISKIFPQVNINWLLTGEGEMTRKGPNDTPPPTYNKEGGEKDWELLAKSHTVLISDTIYAQALAANVNAFFFALTSEAKLRAEIEALKKSHKDLLDKINQMATMHIELNEKVAHLETIRWANDQIRKDDPPEQKDEILKRRVS